MIKKCINCCKWITCNSASSDKYNCENFNFKRIKYERKEEYEKRKRNKKSNKTIM